jgi:dienelactone hydrolase
MRKIQFESHGCKLNGYLFIPDTWICPQKLPCICIVPGGHGLVNKIKTTKDQNGNEIYISSAVDGLLDLSRGLQSHGFVAFAYDSRGMGGEHPQLPKSEGKRNEQKVSQEDVEAALNFLETINCVDQNRIGAFGQSVGGAAIAYQSVEDKRLKSLVLWGTPPSYDECVKNGILKLEKTGLNPKSKLLNIDEIIGLIRQPVLLAGGSEDKNFFNLNQQQRNFNGLNSSKIVSLLMMKDFEHRIDACYPIFPVLVSFLNGWFRSTL